DTNGIALLAAEPSILDTLSLTVSSGRFLDPATGRYPVVVLGAATARALGIASVGAQIYLGSSTNQGGRYAVVIGILAPAPLAPELDTAALIGNALATSAFGFTGAPT